MTLQTGAHLGPYRIQSALGAGGMGEVYKARDTRLDRTVAIKVLSPELSADPQFRERFDREARAISALDHPHICALYDVGEQDGTSFFVMQYLEGETLEHKLAGSGLSLEDALTVAIQMADALDAAHGAGIVHRDLKPSNVMLTKSGVKLLDFGLAKTAGPAVAGGGLSMLATQPLNLTAQGTILGTFQYMAPEQLEGREADPRTDIFAFGAVAYEMFTGRKAFEGKNQVALIGAILKDTPPPLSSLQPLASSTLDHVVSTCLAKHPDQRWQSAADLKRELQWIVGRAAEISPSLGGVSRRHRFGWALAAVAALAFALGSAMFYFRRAPSEAPTMRLEVTTPPTSDPASMAISPDGRRLVFAATSEGRTQLWIRSLDSVTAQPLAGTDGGRFPFWSPDSRAIGFFADAKLKRMDISGGRPQTLANATGAGGSWNRDGVIIFAPTGGTTPIDRVAATGGDPVAVTRPDPPRQFTHRAPQFLPDGRHFLYFAAGGAEPGVYVSALDAPEGRRLIEADGGATYVPPGYLLFVRQGTLIAQPFNADRLELAGDAVQLAENVAAASAAASGIVAYRTRPPAGRRQLAWFDRSGKLTGSITDLEDTDTAPSNPELSPNDRQVALDRAVDGNRDIWLFETARGLATRLTFDAASDATAVWSPDGSRLVFRSNRNGVNNLYQKLASGASAEEPFLDSPLGKLPEDWSPDGRVLLFRLVDPKTGRDLWGVPLQGERRPFPVVQTEFEERDGQFAPDGRWIAYASDASGRFEVYVQPFPGPGGKWQISTGGGTQPRWRHDGKEIFYLTLDGTLMATPITFAGQAVEAGRPATLFTPHVVAMIPGDKQQYAVTHDGQRFLINTTTEVASSAPITLILNWTASLGRRTQNP